MENMEVNEVAFGLLNAYSPAVQRWVESEIKVVGQKKSNIKHFNKYRSQ